MILRRDFQAEGAKAKAAGKPISSCAYQVGSWVWLRWLEGWSGSACPERAFAGGGFNMTPKEELLARAEWLAGIGVDERDRAQSEAMFRLGYTAEALGSVH